jgi:O-methyltransferase
MCCLGAYDSVSEPLSTPANGSSCSLQALDGMRQVLRDTKRFLKRSRSLHAVVKLAKVCNKASLRRWANVSRTADIFRVLPNTMVPPVRLMNAYDCMRFAELHSIEGDVAECGVWEGGCIGLMASASERLGGRRNFHLFDSFKGLPVPSAQDLDIPGAKTAELSPIGACVAARETAERLFYDVLRVDRHRVVFHEGWFQNTVPAAARSIRSLSILRVDGDWYESTKVCLAGLYDLVVDGGFVIVDDYGTFIGCRQAVDEFFAERGIDPRSVVPIDDEGVYFRKPRSDQRAETPRGDSYARAGRD